MTNKLDTLALTGKSGCAYNFRLYVWATRFKAVPAVYVVTERVVEPGSAPAYKPVFIGTTPDISKVFAKHPQQDCFDLYYANTIAVLQHADEAARTAIAQDLIAALLPPCNSEEPV